MQILELSLNTFGKSGEELKKLNESMFNSTITESNTPINAIRKVSKGQSEHKEPVQPAPSNKGNPSIIAEDPEAEDEEYEDRVPVPNNIQLDPPSEDEIKEKPTPKDEPKTKKKEEEDKKKSKKEKDSKKEPAGYNIEEITKGKKMMENPDFKSNLEKLRKHKQQAQIGNPTPLEIQTKPKTQQAPVPGSHSLEKSEVIHSIKTQDPGIKTNKSIADSVIKNQSEVKDVISINDNDYKSNTVSKKAYPVLNNQLPEDNKIGVKTNPLMNTMKEPEIEQRRKANPKTIPDEAPLKKFATKEEERDWELSELKKKETVDKMRAGTKPVRKFKKPEDEVDDSDNSWDDKAWS